MNAAYEYALIMQKSITRLLSYSIILLAFLTIFPPTTFAVNYGSGYYTNICGTGTAATANACNAGCNLTTGVCTGSQATVTKYTCNGLLTECRSNEESFSTSHAIGTVPCNQTVQIDVYKKNCRQNGQWVCSASDLSDYFVWYSGTCASTPTPTNNVTPTLTPSPTTVHQSSCDQLEIVSGNNAFLPTNVTFRIKGTDTGGQIQAYKLYFGDSGEEESTTPEIRHRYDVSGTFIARAMIKDTRGVWKRSPGCEATVTVKPLPIEPWRSECANVFLTEGNNVMAPTTVKFLVTGYDTKGAIRNYKIDFGTSETAESTNGVFEKRYDKPGTYIVHGFIYDTKDNWKTNENSCRQTVTVLTTPIATQPETGVPTVFTAIALSSGLAGVLFLRVRKAFSP